MGKIFTALYCFITFTPCFAQTQLETGLYNTISLARYYGLVKSEDKNMNEGGKIDFGRNSIILDIHSPVGETVELSYGVCYSSAEYSFVDHDAGLTGPPKPVTYDNSIHQKYQGISPVFGFRFPWAYDPVKLYAGVLVFPQFVIQQDGYYHINHDYKKTNRTGFSHLDSRFILSLLFNEETYSHFTLSAFFQPPAIFFTNVIEKRIGYFNLGIGIGWTFELEK